MKNINMLQYIWLVLLWVIPASVWAKTVVTKDSLEGTAGIIANQSKTVADPFNNNATAVALYDLRANGRVSLCINPKKTAGIPTTATTLVVEIDYKVFDGTSIVSMPKKTVTLSVAYAGSGAYTNNSYVDLGPAYYIVAKVTSATGVNAASKLLVEIQTERYYAANVSLGNLNHNTPDVPNSQLRVTWDSIANAEYYELEWAPVESFLSLDANSKPVDVTDLTLVPVGANYFKYNSTRVATNNAHYDIPLIYERGHLVFRARAVYFKVLNNTKVEQFTAWTVEDNINVLNDFSTAHRVQLLGFEDQKNWQTSISYAEEGKNKAMVSFADGTLRKRQDLTRLNTESKTLVGDLIYDHQGRVAIHTLPVPTDSLSLNYRSNFTRNSIGSIYDRKNFDYDQSPNDCTSPIAPMDSISGASRYYSTRNPFADAPSSGAGKIVNRNLIPKAGGYPFSQTVYTPDHTGRIAAISTPGSVMKIGGGHETKMFYGTPTQEELYRLFGNDVGNAMYYKKNLVRDANGQYTISYVDMNGRIIATSLAGDGPANLKKLASNTASVSITSDLLGNYQNFPDQSANKKMTDGKGYEFNKSLAILDGNRYKLDYKLTSGSYAPDACAANGQPSGCYHCVLDVETSFKEKPCADNLSKAPNFKFGKSGNDCPGKDSSLSLYDNVVNQGGTYVLSKKVKINEAKLETYTQQYLSSACVKNLQYFINDESAKADPNWCGLTCDQCKDKFVSSVGTYSQWAARFSDPKPTLDNYNAFRDKTCLNFCDTKWNECSIAFELMLSDVSPLGQYGEIYQNSFKTASSDGLVSIDPATGQPIDNTGDQGPGLNTGNAPNTDGGDGFTATTDYDFGAFNVEVHNLSVFKENNALLHKEIPGTTTHETINPNWRNPIWVDNGSVFKAYYDDEDHLIPSFIPVQLQADGVTYKPAIVDASKVTGDGNGGLHTVPENLKEVQDFATVYWKQNWAHSLVFFHPEYPYYQDCIANLSSVTFDEKWNSINTLQIAENNQFVNRNTLRFDPTTVDPYFANGKHAYELKVIRKKMRNYGVDPSGSGKVVNIWALANKVVNCNTTKSCSLACADTLKIDSDQEWLIFKSLYASAKRDVARTAAQKLSIKNIYYNGCVGNANFDESEYGFSNYFLKQETVTGYRHCNIWQSIWGCTEGPYTYNETTVYQPSQDAAQYCYRGNAPDYKDKTKRFWPETGLGGDLSALQGAHCFDTLRVDAVRIDYIEVPCPQDVRALADGLRAEASRKIYSECGICPLVWDLEHFLGDMAKTHKLSQPTVDLSCPPANGVALFTPLIERAFVSNNGTLSNNRIQYLGTLSAANKTLSIKFAEVGGTVPSVSQLVLNIDPGSAYDFTQLYDICCIEVSNTSDPNLQGKLFTAIGKVKFLGISIIEVPIQGVSSVPLAPCTIPARCAPSVQSVQIPRLLNALNATMGGKTNDLLDHSGNLDLINNVGYEIIMDQLEGLSDYKTQNPSAVFNFKWSGTATGTKLTGTIAYSIVVSGSTVMQGNKVVELTTPSGTSVDFSKVVNFSNIRMKPCATEACQSNTFTMDVQFRNASTGQISIVTMDGNTSYFIGSCKQAIAFENSKN